MQDRYADIRVKHAQTADYASNGGGGSPSSSGVFVGLVTKGSSFPTRRLDGSPLQAEDYVKVDANTPDEDFPFVISGVTFTNRRDEAFYLGSNRWQINPGAIQTTSETPTTNKDAESLNGNGTTQAQVNLQVANMIGKKKSVAVADKTNILDALNFAWEELQKAGYTFTLSNTDSDSIRDIKLTIKDYNDNVLLEKELKDFILKTRKVAGYDLVDDITDEEIQEAIKEITATLKNKSMSADDNTFTDFETDNFKDTALAKSTDNVRDYASSVDTKLTTEKFIQKVLQNIATPQNTTDAVNKEYVDDLVEGLSGKVMKFKGFVSSTTPTGTIADGTLWYQGSTMPTTFPINVKTYDATNSQWSSTTTEYSPTTLDLWSSLDDEKGYYWFGNKWNLIDENVLTDDVMIMKNQNGELTFKTKTSADKYKTWVLKADGTWGLELKTDWVAVSSFDNITFDERTLYILTQDTTYEQETYKVGFYTWDETNGLVARSSLVEVDNVTIGRDANDKLEVKDGGITFAKFNSDLTKQSLANDYYFKFSDGTNTYYTKTITDGTNIDVYAITITNNKITAITLQETKGTLANGVLTFSSVEYAHNVFGDGFYVVGDDQILITISALQDILEKAGKVNDVKVAGVSQVKNKEANIQTIDNVEDNWYYAFKNGSTYYYTKSKATGSTAYYQFTYTDNVLTKIENKGNVTVELNANRVPQITISSTIYTLDETKNDYYIINPKQKLPSAENETRDFTQAELDRIFDGFYITPPNPSWKYVGILSSSNGSTLKVGDDWTELLLVARVSEGSSYYNLTNVIPKYGFTRGNPNGNNTFAGFFWNESYNCKLRVGLDGTGTNRVVKQNYSNAVGWVLNGTYIFKR